MTHKKKTQLLRESAVYEKKSAEYSKAVRDLYLDKTKA